MGFLLKELGPSNRPSVEDRHILAHHFLVGFEILVSLEAVGVNPAGANGNRVQLSELHTRRMNTVRKALRVGSVFLPTLLPLSYSLMTDTTTASPG